MTFPTPCYVCGLFHKPWKRSPSLKTTTIPWKVSASHRKVVIWSFMLVPPCKDFFEQSKGIPPPYPMPRFLQEINAGRIKGLLTTVVRWMPWGKRGGPRPNRFPWFSRNLSTSIQKSKKKTPNLLFSGSKAIQCRRGWWFFWDICYVKRWKSKIHGWEENPISPPLASLWIKLVSFRSAGLAWAHFKLFKNS